MVLLSIYVVAFIHSSVNAELGRNAPAVGAYISSTDVIVLFVAASSGGPFLGEGQHYRPW
jgi:hypothetical protein